VVASIPSYLSDAIRARHYVTLERVAVVAANTLTLDTLENAALDRLVKWTPDLPRSDALLYLLRYLIARLFVAGNGNLSRARFQACQQTLGSRIHGKDKRGISREWTNKLLGRLVEAGWIYRLTIRVSADRNAPCLYGAGRQLKRLYISLLKLYNPKPAANHNRSDSPSIRSVNAPSQSLPSEQEKRLRLIREVEEKLPHPTLLAKIPLLKKWMDRGEQ
jgi:hypothetical protein